MIVISQRVPLHRYPAHALQALTASFPIKELVDYTNRYMSLCQAHSRFVLLLQSYVHSSNDTVVGEPDDGSWNVQTTVGRQLRELIFPAPLSNAEDESPVIGETSQRLLKMTSPNSVTRYPTPSGTSHSSFSKKSTTFTLFRNSSLRLRSSFSNPVPPPKPTSELHAMKMYPSAWRRSSMRHSLRLNSGYISTSSIPSRSRHSVGGNSSAPPTLPPLLFRSASPVSASGALPVRIASHHDLNLAVTRTRAPVLRTFVPCSSLEDDSTGVLMCEQQLIDAGLWDHLSAGDIVCNLGYVPPAGPTSHLGTPSSNNRIATDQRQYSRSNSGYYQHSFDKCQPSFSRKWLMFNGQYLVPFTPPEPVRLSEPLTLPSPLYYSHIMPPSTNPVFALDHSAFEDMVQNVTPEMRLMNTTIRVQSPHSPSGYALVKKHAWTMRLLRTQTIPSSETCQSSQCLGDGWLGEWILEGEGTKEGKQTLIDCVCGRTVDQMQWEVVRDRTGGGRIWLRLVSHVRDGI
ncbi:hypothetical protein AMATHDRAFT_138238 [Amanita thiersii Skay4041]|uniref:Uncharacterized protein n=1 Tax=Amanita thiersii Skay4041 TaxID=703135 RepID=A0A2A9NXK0_9AGAR|nr:hypothetical protein AMATHDRAFT_138238 [Amanita thiersii Skay4041]